MRRDQPPFLLYDSGARAREQAVTVHADLDTDRTGITVRGDFDTALIEITVRGRWTDALQTTTAAVLRDCLVSRPAGILADLRGLADATGAGAALWSAARLWGTQAANPVPLVACLPATAPLATILGRRDARWGLPVHPSPTQARAALTAVAERPDRVTLHLDPELDTLSPVTRAVAEACAAWGVPSLTRLATAVLTELVANALEHAETRVGVAIGRQSHGLHLTVHDRSPRFPHLTVGPARDPGDPDGRGRGLRVVHTTTTAWGALPTRDGKIVWAILTAPDPRPTRRTRPGQTPNRTRSIDWHD
ncbi:ATP-binding protein [Actinoplanes sp. KI2]|uniref:ATP-binding protein n=1 Tax=Actinoplanes sp. KI2 TaxID=2983315 RepID=UPI0021D5CEDD|nr:ATP-binding protein [Actinoplanes sp. KI2]MCU7727965.1 ATP-binding protein [Actinoplanes sp. KI2]